MKENVLLKLSQDFASEIVLLANDLRANKEFQICDQIKRSGTSISANIAEANYPQSRADMISKFEIALKESSETENWLDIILKSNLIDEERYNFLKSKNIKNKILLIKSIKTLKSKIV